MMRLSTAVAALGALVAGCRHQGAQEFMWVTKVPPAMLVPSSAYVIAPGDVIGVRVWNLEANSIDRTRVREDGRISMPFLNDVEVAGMEPSVLARRLEVKLKEFIQNPVVTVLVHERRPLRVAILGRVTRPGTYDVDEGGGVIQALAQAGGLTAYADEDGIYVLRPGYWADGDASAARIRFRYDDLRRGKAPAATFQLRRGDVIVVE